MAFRIKSKLTFVHIAKCGGNTITDWIRKDTHEYSGEPHELPSTLPNEWQDKMFCVVRNPWSRVVSFFTYFKRTWSKHKKYEYLEVINKGFENFVLRCDGWHPDIAPSIGLPWNEQLCSLYIHPNMEYLRLENLKSDFEKIKKICDRQDDLEKKNQSNSLPYQSFYNDKTIKRVAEMFEQDIKQFNYSYEKI